MPTVYSTLPYSEQKTYLDLQKKIETFQMKCTFNGFSFETLGKIYHAILEDHPEYFWLSGACSGTTQKIGTMVSVELDIEIRDQRSGYQSRVEKSQFDAKVSELISLAKRHASGVFGQVLFLHDYLVLHTDYQLNTPHCYDAYGCLVLGRAVCDGYAAAFQVLMNRLGVECGRVRGSSASARTGEVSHAWNYIKLSDGYYYVDVTWDDPVVSSGTNLDNLSHDYFCLSLEEIRLTHRFSGDQYIPQSIGSAYNYYKYHGLYVERYSFEAVRTAAQKQLKSGNKFSVKFGSKTQLILALHDLMDNQKVYSIPGISGGISYSTSTSGLALTVYTH